MPNPTQSDLHVNVPLTNVSVAYLQSSNAYIADKVFPRVPVQSQSNIYWKYSKSDWRRTDVQKRAPSTESAGVGFRLERDSTEFITNQLLIKRDIDWNNAYFKTGVWQTEYTGVASAPTAAQFLQWNDSGSDPISDVAKWVIDFRKLTGYKPNVMVIGAEVMRNLKQHPDIIDRIKYTQKGIVTEDLIATLFDVEKLMVSYATQTAVPEQNDAALQDAAATYTFLADPKAALLAFSPPSPSLMTPAAGYCFTWNGYMGGNAQGIRVKRFRMEPIASDRIESEMTYDMKVVCRDMGVFLGAAVA
jgi:hypothetical protein